MIFKANLIKRHLYWIHPRNAWYYKFVFDVLEPVTKFIIFKAAYWPKPNL